MDWRILILASLVSSAAAANTTRCFECTDVPDPADCTLTTICTPEQICVVEQFITSGGLVLYNSGCQSKQRCAATGKRGVERRYSHLSKRADVIVCDECCTADFCNNQGCGKLAPKQPTRGPLCFECKVESSPEACRTINKCDLGEVCMLKEDPPALDGSRLFESKCLPPLQCATYSSITNVVGKKKRYNYCHVCCHDDFCNDECVDTPTPAPTQPPTQAPTTTTVATTKATTTTQATTTRAPTTKATTTKATTTQTPTTKAPQQTTVHTNNHATDCKSHQGYRYHYDRHSHSHLCFKFHYDHLTWDAANNVCKSEGGTLAIIDTPDKWNFLKIQIENDHHFNSPIYIGARDTGVGDVGYKWLNGHKVTFNVWGPGEPDHGSEDCVVIFSRTNLFWFDIPCTGTAASICTIPLH